MWIRKPMKQRCVVLYLTHWGRDKTAAILLTKFSNEFSWTKIYEFRLRFHWSFVTKVSINNIPTLVKIMAWRWTGDKLLYEPMMVISLTHICVTKPQCVTSETNSYIYICIYIYINYIRFRPYSTAPRLHQHNKWHSTCQICCLENIQRTHYGIAYCTKHSCMSLVLPRMKLQKARLICFLFKSSWKLSRLSGLL